MKCLLILAGIIILLATTWLILQSDGARLAEEESDTFATPIDGFIAGTPTTVETGTPPFEGFTASGGDFYLTTNSSGNFVSIDPATNTFYCDGSGSCTQPYASPSLKIGTTSSSWSASTTTSGSLTFTSSSNSSSTPLTLTSSGALTIASLTTSGSVTVGGTLTAGSVSNPVTLTGETLMYYSSYSDPDVGNTKALKVSGGASFDYVTSKGYASRSGTTGSLSYNWTNLYWVGSAWKCYLYVDSTQIGYLTATSCDHRIKDQVKEFKEDATSIIKKTKPVTFRWKESRDDGLEHLGFIAHELQEVFPFGVAGEKDGVDKDGRE